jgi:hypothetical protein
MRVQVRKCPFTGELFEEKDKAKYIKHLVSLRENMREERKYDRICKTWKKWLVDEKAKIVSVHDIPNWFLANQRTIMNACNALMFNSYYHKNEKFVKEDKFTKLEFQTCSYQHNASNSHQCPDSGVTNWCAKDKTKPIGYPGFTGYLTGSLDRPAKRMHRYPYTEALNIVGIKTGTGGGGNSDFGYGFTIFIDDWPGLKEEIVLKKLKGNI